MIATDFFYEKEYIKKYNSYGENGYNMTYGGEGTLGWIPSEETKRKIGLANSRSTLTEDGRKRKSENQTQWDAW